MKIAVASEGAMVSGHFGHCNEFKLYTVEEGVISERKSVENPGGCFQIPVYLKSNGVDVVIAGHMGARPMEGLLSSGIEVILGAEGLIEDVVQEYMKGELKTDDSVCADHDHHNHGGCSH